MPSLDLIYLKRHVKNIDFYNKCFVETGTYMGTTINNLEPYFSELHTVEIKESYYNRAKNIYKGDKITFHLGDSSDELIGICKSLENNTIFFLDGHWSSGGTGRGKKDCPLYEELDAIIKNFRYKAVIIIDDVRLFGKGPSNGLNKEQWEDISIEKVLDKVHFRMEEHHFAPSQLYENDRLIISIDNKCCVDLPMFYINLDKRVSRRELIEKEKEKHNLNITRFSAIDGMTMERTNKFISKGHYGCWSSAYKLWEKVRDSGKTTILFQDDIIFNENFSNKLNKILDEAKILNYDIILLAHNWYHRQQKNPVTDNISTIGLFHGLQGYVITSKCAKYLCERFHDSSKWSKPDDVTIGELSVAKDIKVFTSTQNIVTLHELAGGSDTNRGH